MALVVADRVKVSSVATGTGTFALGLAVASYRDFTAIGNGNETYYGITDTSGNWEVGRGTYLSSPPRLIRDTVFSSSNNNLTVNFPTGAKEVFVTLPANEAVVGPPGADGLSIASASVNGSGNLIITLSDSTTIDAGYVKGTNGADGDDGAPGADGADGTNGTNGQGVPVGGTTGQILAKINGTDYNTQWVDAVGGLYTLPTASNSTLGGIKIGSGLSIDGSGVVTASGGTADTGNITFTGSTIDTSDTEINIAKAFVPTVDNVYDLGSPSFRFRHLYVGPGTIYIGDQTRAITATENSIDLPAGTTIAGEEPLKTTIQNIFNEIITNYLIYNDISGAPKDISDLNDSSNTLTQGITQITGITYPVGQAFVLTTGGETVTITGVGFKTLCNVYLNGAPVASTSFVSSTSVTFVTPEVSTVGTYQLTLINPDGTSADWASGLIFVTLASPKFTDPSGLLETFSRSDSHSTTLDVIGGTAPYTFSITAGALPSGLSLNTSTGVISGTTPNVTSDTIYNFIAQVTDNASASSSSAFQIAVVIPVPWDLGLPTFNIVSNRVFFIEYEEDITNTPTIDMPAFNMISNNAFFVEYEEDITNTPTIDMPAFNMISNNAFFVEYEEDITNTPTIELPAFGIRSYVP